MEEIKDSTINMAKEPKPKDPNAEEFPLDPGLHLDSSYSTSLSEPASVLDSSAGRQEEDEEETGRTEYENMSTDESEQESESEEEASWSSASESPESHKHPRKRQRKTSNLSQKSQQSTTTVEDEEEETSRKHVQVKNIDKLDRSGRTAFFRAATRNDVAKMRELRQNGAQLNIVDNAGWTPLHEVCLHGQVDAVRYLLENDADINARARNGDSSLHDACENLHVAVVDLLLEFGANPHLKNEDGLTPLAALTDKRDQLHQILTEDGGDEEYSEEDRSKLQADKEVCDLLIRKLQDYISMVDDEISFRNEENGISNLHMFLQENSVTKVKQLVNSGHDLNIKDFESRFPLLIACQKQNSDIVSFLLNSGADVNFQDGNGETVMHYCARNGLVDIARICLQHGANLSITNNDGKTPNDVAVNTEHLNLFTIKEEPVKKEVQVVIPTAPEPVKQPEPELSAREQKKLQMYLQQIERLENAAPSSPTKTKERKSPVKREPAPKKVSSPKKEPAAVSKDVEAGKKRGRPPNISKKDVLGRTQLHICSKRGDLTGVRRILSLASKVDDPDNSGYTALHLASANGHYEIANLLITKGASVNSVSNDNSTPLHLASEGGHLNIVKLLLENKANAQIANYEGKLPADMTNDVKIAKIIQRAINPQERKPKRKVQTTVQIENVSVAIDLGFGTVQDKPAKRPRTGSVKPVESTVIANSTEQKDPEPQQQVIPTGDKMDVDTGADKVDEEEEIRLPPLLQLKKKWSQQFGNT